MSTPIDNLLARLDGVRQRKPGQWLAKCPAHDDRHPSLLIEVGDDDRVLLYCYASCPALDIVSAVGLNLADLFPRRIPDSQKRQHRRRPTLSARDAMDAIDIESAIIMVTAADIVAGRAISADDINRIMVARQRIARVAEMVR